MSVETTLMAAQPTPAGDYPQKVAAWRKLARNPLGIACLAFLLLVVAFAVLGPVLIQNDPADVRLELTNAPPFTGGYILGGDSQGRDVFARLAVASGQTLIGALIVLAVASLIGISAGLIAGYYAGRFEVATSWISDALMALPGIILLMALYPLIGTNIRAAMAVFGILIAPAFYRTARAQSMAVRQELYVDAARIAGLSNARIISRHVLRAVRGPLLIMSGGIVAAGIGIQAGLEYLGMGDPTVPSWGAMMQDAFNNMYVARLPILWPAGLMTLTILALVLLGNAMRDAFETTASELLRLKPAALGRIRSARAEALGVDGGTRRAVLESRPNQILQIDHLSIGYPTGKDAVKEVVRGVSLRVAKGEVHGIVGESGSGKTQTAFAILGILPPTACLLDGQIRFEGRDLVSDRDYQREIRGRRIGYIPQEPMANLDPSVTVGSQLNEGLRSATGVSKARAREKLLGLLARVGISDPERTYNSYPHQISGGMAQRVLIAGAVASDPDFLIADEPTTALDVTVQAEVLDLLRELQSERGLGMILVTHNLGVVADICDTVSVMKEGRIIESNPSETLFDDPREEYTQMLLSSTLEDSPLRAPLATEED